MKFIIDEEEYIELQDVLKMTGINQTDLYIKIKYNEFPKQKKMIVPTPRKRSLWKKSEIDAYLEATCGKES
jgi:predicted DNA-binding transcriptional regulator AlpA